ncbi:hypothetical protein K0M31_019807, partial [Melipona bicolor]
KELRRRGIGVSSFSVREQQQQQQQQQRQKIFKPMNFPYPLTLFHRVEIGEATSGVKAAKKSARDTGGTRCI